MILSARILLLSTLILAPGCSRRPAMTVKNQSPHTISNVVVSGTGFTENLGSIPSGGEHRLRVRPTGDSGMRLVFDAAATHVDSGSRGYFESSGGYHMTAIVGTNLSVTVIEDHRSF